ncbi:MGH1-like glycoside hydrolase domain-containing protein [Sphingobacterium bovistauri]|uniref:Glycoside hydrolase n=1 Tax=Sphingobacterium bovistauri TaxID=2781959 RepID=A0ABS7Z3J1_9SPHI|nr:glycosyl hydrolase family 65 protein [Sphingobacterium bovistauri]MCA5004746.1 glycoside hydrolase [Sphingobacterium bovistauri]
MIKKLFILSICYLAPCYAFSQTNLTEKIDNYVSKFNSQDNEAVVNMVPNSRSAEWLKLNIPLVDIPDSAIEQTYYFRWWSYRKHLKQTPEGIIVTEFIEPVKHAGKFNSISCALGHHVYEGRWLRNNDFLKEYIDFWFYHADQGQSRPRFHQFSSWIADAMLQYYKVDNDKHYVLSRLDDLDRDLDTWEKERLLDNGLFWQHDVKDGMEESVSGGRNVKNMRPTINSYMYANAAAMIELAKLAGRTDLIQKYEAKSKTFKSNVIDSLWDNSDKFFKTKLEKGQLHHAREAIGFIPWYFNIVPDAPEYAQAWKQVNDPDGFNGQWGLTTAERREPTFQTRGTGRSCEWDGPIWPFASSQTLKGMSNFLVNYKNNAGITKADFYNQVAKYAKSHVMNGKSYVGEYQDDKSGYWLKGDDPRSKFYNHSTYADVIINDLLGFKPSLDNSFSLNPLIPEGTWDYFALENLRYKGRDINIYWDKAGLRYQKGKGLKIFVDGELISSSSSLKDIKIKLK